MFPEISKHGMCRDKRFNERAYVILAKEIIEILNACTYFALILSMPQRDDFFEFFSQV